MVNGRLTSGQDVGPALIFASREAGLTMIPEPIRAV